MRRILERHVALTENLELELEPGTRTSGRASWRSRSSRLSSTIATPSTSSALDSQGCSIYEIPPPDILATFETIQRSFPELLASLRERVGVEMFCQQTIKFGRYRPEIHLGEHAAVVAKAKALRTKLEPRFYEPATPVHLRHAWVRALEEVRRGTGEAQRRRPPLFCSNATGASARRWRSRYSPR